MVKEFQQHSRIDWPWSASVYAFFERYPNPTATHVLSVDVIDRRIVPRSTPHSQWPHPAGDASSSKGVPDPHSATPFEDPLVLRTTRLLLKKGTLPKWAPKGLLKNAESWVLEESEVELQPSIGNSGEPKRNMRSWTRNIDHTTVLAVTEALRFKEGMPQSSPAANQTSTKGKERAVESSIPSSLSERYTLATTSAQIASEVSFAMLRRRIESFGLTRFITHKDASRDGHVWAIQTHWLPHTQQQDQKELELAETEPKRRRLIASAFRPPFLDGLPARPSQRLRQWIEDGSWLAPHRQGQTLVKAQVYDDRSAAEEAGPAPAEEPLSRLQRARLRLAQWLGYSPSSSTGTQ